jgi:hypothetical protein
MLGEGTIEGIGETNALGGDKERRRTKKRRDFEGDKGDMCQKKEPPKSLFPSYLFMLLLSKPPPNFVSLLIFPLSWDKSHQFFTHILHGLSICDFH